MFPARARSRGVTRLAAAPPRAASSATLWSAHACQGGASLGATRTTGAAACNAGVPCTDHARVPEAGSSAAQGAGELHEGAGSVARGPAGGSLCAGQGEAKHNGGGWLSPQPQCSRSGDRLVQHRPDGGRSTVRPTGGDSGGSAGGRVHVAASSSAGQR
eukprot:scaffold31815_cov118-Isochrysis_galbana.AAC.22